MVWEGEEESGSLLLTLLPCGCWPPLLSRARALSHREDATLLSLNLITAASPAQAEHLDVIIGPSECRRDYYLSPTRNSSTRVALFLLDIPLAIIRPPASSLDYYFFFILVLCVSLYLIILIVRQFVSRTYKSAARRDQKKLLTQNDFSSDFRQ